MQNIFKILLLQLIILFLIGCGGGESGNSSGNTGEGGSSGQSGNENSEPSFIPNCSGDYCGSSGNTYTGSGVGVWHYKNNGNKNVALNVSLSNVTGKNITVVFTNEGSRKVSLPYIYVNSALKNEMSVKNTTYIDTFNYIPDSIREFNSRDFIPQELESYQSINYQILAKTWILEQEREWYITNANDKLENRMATLKRQIILANGRVINMWIETSEYGNEKITDELIDNISQKLKTVVSNATNLIGEPWGEHGQKGLILGNQPLDIVFVDFNNKGSLWTLGYFYGLNNFLNGVYGDKQGNKYTIANSNEALAIFVDTKALYTNAVSNNILLGISTIAHELTHAIQFYQRNVLMPDGFDTFLNEMAAIMMEDIIAQEIDPMFNDVEKRYKKWHNNSLYGQNLADWEKNSNSDGNYNVAASFGAYLLRQYGTDFYKELFQTKSDSSISESNTNAKSINILDEAIKTFNGEGLGHALQRWGASIAMLPADKSPKGFGYPSKNDNNGFYFEEFDGSVYKQYRSLPQSSPSILEGYAHFPFLRKAMGYTYTEKFTVPSNVSVSIIVQ
ncbi:MAG: hypothetical protein LBG21_05605 [Campylobacteraceae bacterium]|jgi:hypothetical protein|nr:hypothetical protein [Campylobacteraceae bacterium]